MFKDHFSKNSIQYGLYRPEYPDNLFQYLSAIVPTNDKAWDCACGTGQATLGLQKYFREVVGTDASANQINQARKSKNISFRVSDAEKSEFIDKEVDLVTVAQALHWYNISAFFQEARRVLKNNGILAVWTYNLLRINNDIDEIVDRLYNKILFEHWPPERRMVENCYQDINFPFEKITPPTFQMEAVWNLKQVIGYLETWSAIQDYKKNNAPDEITNCYSKIKSLWGDPASKQTIVWPLTVIVRTKIT